jgi:nitroimidazol reductase NimA-like FMN-containing flavoprotein (pyridoxamine 5'-phosphate oxidase superfamily)
MSEVTNSIERATVKRLPARGVYDRAVIHQILDAGLVCHLGFVVEGQPFVIPTTYVRVDDTIYVHGSPASRMLQSLERGIAACLTVTLVDGLVLARSAFHHSINYRSVVVFGTAVLVSDSEEKLAAMKALTDHLIPGRWQEIRQPSQQELKRTLVLCIRIDEASAKVRVGPPIDDEEDYQLDVWAGVIPLKMTIETPIADARLSKEISPPGYAAAYGGPK